jgi:hypothetical protein
MNSLTKRDASDDPRKIESRQRMSSRMNRKHPKTEGYRKNAKKEFEENQNYVGDEEFHQEPDHPSTFMKMVKERTWTN